MTYLELDKIKKAVKDFRLDKNVYATGDVLLRMRDKIAEEMAMIGYTYIQQRGKNIEELFVERLRVLLFNARRLGDGGQTYINMADLNVALSTIKTKSIYD